MAYSAFGINYDTAAKIEAYGGDADVPAQPVFAEDTHQLWIVHGTAGKYRVVMAADLTSELGKYLSKEVAKTSYLGISAKADSAKTADDAVKKSGDRSALAGYESVSAGAAAITIKADSPDDQVVTGAVAITVADGAASQTWQKNVVIKNAGATVVPGAAWKWAGGKAPEMKANSLLVCKWVHDVGFLSLVLTE